MSASEVCLLLFIYICIYTSSSYIFLSFLISLKIDRRRYFILLLKKYNLHKLLIYTVMADIWWYNSKSVTCNESGSRCHLILLITYFTMNRKCEYMDSKHHFFSVYGFVFLYFNDKNLPRWE